MKNLSGRDIKRIYQQKVLVNKNKEYLERYKKLPLRKNNKKWKWEGKNFPRVITLLEFERMVKTYRLHPQKLLMYNGGPEGDPELEYLKARKIIRVDFNEKTETNDLHNLNLVEKDFDFILFSQTLEHTYHPIRCVSNLYRHLQKGGYVFTSVPVNNISHSAPYHYYTGYTPVGLGAVFEAAGFTIIEIGQWGNLKHIHYQNNHKSWPDYRLLRKGFHGMCDLKNLKGIFQDGTQNDFDNPVDCWILAQKQSGA